MKMRISTTIIRQSLRYVCIGALASTVDASLYFVFTRFASLPFLLANFTSVNIGITVSFLLNTFVNFRQPTNLLARAVSFYGVCYAGMLLSMGLLGLGTGMFGPVAGLEHGVFVGILQFTLNKLVTFGRI